MTTFYTIDAAERRLPEVRDILEQLRDQRADLVGLRDEMLERIRELQRTTAGQAAGTAPGSGDEDEATRASIERDPTIRGLRLRMQGIVDQMQAGVTRLVDWDVTLRDIQTGLIDFPALASGRPIWLCWRLGEDGIGWWHEHDRGFSSRRPLAELE